MRRAVHPILRNRHVENLFDFGKTELRLSSQADSTHFFYFVFKPGLYVVRRGVLMTPTLRRVTPSIPGTLSASPMRRRSNVRRNAPSSLRFRHQRSQTRNLPVKYFEQSCVQSWNSHTFLPSFFLQRALWAVRHRASGYPKISSICRFSNIRAFLHPCTLTFFLSCRCRGNKEQNIRQIWNEKKLLSEDNRGISPA